MSSKLIDLTKPLNSTLTSYTHDGYSDPKLVIKPWCNIDEQGFSVFSLKLGTQTGTHIDAPSHFFDAGDTLEKLAIDNLIGPYYFVNAQNQILNDYKGEKILFLGNIEKSGMISRDFFNQLIKFPANIWVIPFELNFVDAKTPYEFHYELAKIGKYLVEDLEPTEARKIDVSGHAYIMPLKLEGVSGSPCRVVFKGNI